MKHVYLSGVKHYAFCATDPLRKEAAVYIATSLPSVNGERTLKKVIERFGVKIIIVNNNGRENMGKAHAFLRELGIRQYRTAPNPKLDPQLLLRQIYLKSDKFFISLNQNNSQNLKKLS